RSESWRNAPGRRNRWLRGSSRARAIRVGRRWHGWLLRPDVISTRNVSPRFETSTFFLRRRSAVANPTPLDRERLIKVLAKHGVHFVLIGALAARLQGFPRLTADADITPAR